MTPHEFIEKWSKVALTERAAAQSHFNDLCALLGEPAPIDVDPKGDWYAFERGALKTGGGNGWADVWKRHHFAWEYKRDHANLEAAFAQLQRYSLALENPPLLIVADTKRFRIHTNWTNSVQQITEIELDDLLDAQKRQILKLAFADPDKLKPDKTRRQLTENAASAFVQLAKRLRERGYGADEVAHFVNRMVFCMFAEDVNLLPSNLFTKMLEASLSDPGSFQDNARQLFEAMRSKGGRVGFERVEWFNGGLFDDDTALPLEKEDVKEAVAAARLDWSNIDPSIMGTLFERGLDPDKRSQLGAHYTDAEKIMLIVNPVIVEPLTREWEEIKLRIEDAIAKADVARTEASRTRSPQKAGAFTRQANTALAEAQQLRTQYLERLKNFRVLDPACGSGNFLYLALRALKDLEHRANLEAEALGLPREFPRVGPECVKGIEINPFAAELARVSVWIGEIQWMQRHGFDAARNPILKPLETIECRDALLNEDGTEAEWPETDVIIGNPPFLGAQRMIGVLGEAYTVRLRDRYRHVPGTADLVIWWFAKAYSLLVEDAVSYFGFVGTQAIRRGGSLEVLRQITNDSVVFSAWADEPWVVEGANVRVSVVCCSRQHIVSDTPLQLNGLQVTQINADLTANVASLVAATGLATNLSVAFRCPEKNGPFEIDGLNARDMLLAGGNPNKRPNSDVIRRWITTTDLTSKDRDFWIIDFGPDRSEIESSIYERPFEYVVETVKPVRQKNRRTHRAERWWLHGELARNFRNATANLARFIVTPRVSKHRFFVWITRGVLPDSRLFAIAKDDDIMFGILHSRVHETWSLATCSWHGDGDDGGRPTYNAQSCFETFPFPEGLTPDIPAADYANDPRAQAIAAAAKQLNDYREAWLNPPDWTMRVPEVVLGYPDRILPRDDLTEDQLKQLKKRTLTNLYNERPAWLDNAHLALDEAVADAYGWPRDLRDDEILESLFHLNQERAGTQYLQ